MSPKSIQRAENGIAMIEFLVVIPIFILILFNIISLGPFLNVYLSTAHVSHEGARMLSNSPALDRNTRVITVWQFNGTSATICHREQGGTGFPTCPPSPTTPATIPESHRLVHDRVGVLLNALRLENVFTDRQIGVVSNYSDAADNVTFTIYGRYRGWAGFLLGNVVVVEEGPYLY